MKKLALFDLDGTLFDTEMVNFHAYQKAIEEVGFTLDYEEFKEKCIGRQFRDFIVEILPNQEELYKTIHKRKKELYKTFLNKARVNKHLIEIASLMKKEYNIAIVTTASKENVNDILKEFQLENFFDYVLTGDDVTHNKPNPECYLKAIEHFGAKIEDVIIFEDSLPGIQAAEQTGATIFLINKF